jgi:hypothetical protein
MDECLMSKVIIAVGFLALLSGQQTLNNEAVVNLRKAGFSEDLIIAVINRSQGAYDASAGGLNALRDAGITDREISAIVAKASAQASAVLAAPPGPTALPLPARSANKPRVFLRARSHTRGWNESRDQSMEMSKDFQQICPEVQISVDPHLVDYSVELNHTEHSFVRENQMQIADKDGDLLANTEGSIKAESIKGGVKRVCDAIRADWARK